MFRGQLAADVQKGDSVITIEPIGAMDNFSATGGDAYIGRDKIAYTGIAGDTLTGCTDITFSHVIGEEINPWYGMRFRDIAPPALKTAKNDPDGLLDAIMELLEGMFKYLKDRAINVHQNMDPVRADELFLKYLVSNIGVEFSEDVSVDRQRSLARQCVDLLCMRGTESAFRFIVWHVLNYDVSVFIERYKIPARMNDRNYRMYIPPTPMEIESRTAGYWKFTEGVGMVVANEVSGGPQMRLVNAAQWSTDSMFPKDLSIKTGLVHTYAEIEDGASVLGNLWGKEQFALEWFMAPDTSANWPQRVIYKGSLIKMERLNATDIKITMSDGVITANHTFTDCITPNIDNYVSVLYDRPTLILMVNGDIIDMDVTFDIKANDPGDNWIIGDKTGVNPYEGRFDTFRITVGKKYPAECYQYFEHIKWLRTYGTNADRNSYMLDDFTDDGRVIVEINNGDGDVEKESLLAHLIEEWLCICNYTIIPTGQLPVEIKMDMW